MKPLGSTTVFYIQASAYCGMGHLARSAALIGSLEALGIESLAVLRVDEQARALAHNKGLTARETELQDDTPAAARIVIDAVHVPDEDASNLMKSPQRILISPVCDRADIATHALLRSVPEGLRNRLSPDCLLYHDDRFAYATAAGLSPRVIDHNGRLVVGICLSGGSHQPALGALLSATLAAPGVEAVYIIHPRAPETIGSDAAVYHKFFCDEPWTFLAPINVFVGGDGVMIAEAVAQALPCLSVTRSGAPAKNRALVEAGCVEACSYDDAPAAMAALLSDRPRLAGMHRAALLQGAGQAADALHRAIAQLAGNGGT